ncbi:MAG: UDP-N-acetylmuramate dehydrogenase [Micrococcales bacterium]|nr:UDP-N-acetylmuramate dehydrogenase [Micrococcales bacterium]
MTASLAELTTLRVGGPAARLLEPTTELELVQAAQEAWRDDEWFVLGGGSNVVVADEGFDGTVIRVGTRGVRRIDGAPEGRVRVRAQAGEPWDALVQLAQHNGWAGLEALSGIPGSTGAAPIQNIGAYGQEVAQTLAAVDLLDGATGHRVRVPASDLQLGYRTSALKQGRVAVVIAVEFDLVETTARHKLSAPIRYPQLAAALEVAVGERAPLGAVREAVLALRTSKGMVLDPADPDSVSAGSFFTNPIVDENVARGLPRDLPRWPVEPEEPPQVLPAGSEPEPRRHPQSYSVKLSAAWLIERAGIGRGFALPGSRAGTSSKHTLAIVNRGGATALEIAQLAAFIQTRVASQFGIALHPEPAFVGFEV